MKKTILILLTMLLISFSNINAATIFVDASVGSSGDGSSWANGYQTLQEALDVASSGDEIWVAKGTYYPTTEVGGTGTRYQSFQMIDGVTIYGGFAGTESATSERTDFNYGGTNETTLSGDYNNDDVITGSGATLSITGNSENSYHVFYHTSGYSLTSGGLDGFTLKGGNANGSANPWNDGGAIYNADGQTPTINNCYFTGNNVNDNGGAIFNAFSTTIVITNSTFALNYATDAGGAIGNYDSDPTITNCLFYGNRAKDEKGGAIYNYGPSDNTGGSNAVITNATFTGNYSINGGAIYNYYNSDITIINTILYGNTIDASGSGTQVRNAGSSDITISYSDIGGDIAGGVASTSTSSTTDGGNNINSDPKFIGSSLNSAHPYSITGDSPCADVGDGTANSENYDIRGTGFNRKLSKTDGNTGTIDIGAYEYKFDYDAPTTGRVYVNDNAGGDNSGRAWQNAFTSFQSALDIAASGDEIWVAAGTYKPSSAYDLTNTSRYNHFRMINGVTIYGGFAGTETASSARTDYGSGGANETILSGDFNGDDVVSGSGSTLSITNNTENSYHVFYHPDTETLTATAILDGFTISGANSDGSWPNNCGGGMFNNAASPSINNCTFLGNSVTENGGGIYNISSSPSVSNCIFTKNSSKYGGGINNNGSNNSPNITYCIFSGNSASFYGGGINGANNSSANITACNFDANYAGQGGGMYNTNSTPVVTNCVFTNNSTQYDGGGMNINSCSPTIINCTFSQNISSRNGGGIFLSGSPSTPSISNTIIWDNTASSSGDNIGNSFDSDPTFSYCDIEGSGGSTSWAGATFGTDGGFNIDNNPRFVGLSVNASHPYSIIGTSPCVDVGDDAAISETYDIRGDGYFRKSAKTSTHTGTVDMGAYEYKFGDDPAFAAQIYVNSSATGNDDGYTWTDAYTSFQSALSEAASGQEIWVAKGTYKPSEEIDGTTDTPREFAFQMINGVNIYGGFAGTETATSQRTDFGSGGVNETILSGDIGTADDDSDNCYHVFYNINTISNTTIFDGFTITKGNADGLNPHNYGGGMYLYNSTTPLIYNCTFIGNSSASRGGAIYLSPWATSNNATIDNCNFETNSGDRGSAIYDSGSPTTISNCSFSNNSAASFGTIYFTSSSQLSNSQFSNNSGGYGGALAFDGASGTVKNCLFYSNTTTSRGGAVYLFSSSSPTFTNCTFAGNSSYDGGAINVNQTSNPNFVNTILWGNTATNLRNEVFVYAGSTPTYSYCNIKGSGGSASWDTALGTDNGSNIDSDPLFYDPDNSDYRITLSSPCTDAGSDAANNETTDIRGAGFDRKLLKTDANSVGTIDIGAYEFKSGTDPDSPTPVELVSFNYEIIDDGTSTSSVTVLLKWETATEINNYGFELQRTDISSQISEKEWVVLGFIEGHGNSNSPKYYEFIDTSAPLSASADSVEYRLKQIDTDGRFTYYAETVTIGNSTTGIEDEELPTEYVLSQNYPNPFNPSTVINYSLPKASNVTLKIYNALGQEVATLVNGYKDAGKFNVTFNASNFASGIYIYRLNAKSSEKEFSSIKKFVLMK